MQQWSITEHIPPVIEHGFISIHVKIQMSLFFVLNHSFWGHDITLSLGNRLVAMQFFIYQKLQLEIVGGLVTYWQSAPLKRTSRRPGALFSIIATWGLSPHGDINPLVV